MTLQDIKSQLFSEFETSLISDLEFDGIQGLTSLRDVAPAEAAAKKKEAIEAVRSGKHVELSMKATTYRQAKGRPNRRYVRLGGDIEKQARTFKSQPFLVDHATWEQASRKGSITSILVNRESETNFNFLMGLHVVKPDAVISVLDGTLDRFSIGWFPRGPVLCSLHGDVGKSESCGCWPGDKVTLEGKTHVVEFEFSAWEGKEVSGVNVPAVPSTSIEDIRTALAAELGIRQQPQRTKEKKMRFPRLAAALSLTVLDDGDEERAVAAVTTLQASLATARAEASRATIELAQAKEALEIALGEASRAKVDAVLDGAYRDGKLVHGRDAQGKPTASPQEALLRHVAKGKEGIAMLEAHIAAMPAIVPLGRKANQALGAGDPVRSVFTGGDTGQLPRVLSQEQKNAIHINNNPYLEEVADQLGLDVNDLVNFRHDLLTRRGEE